MLILLRVLVTRVPLYSATVVILFEKPKPDLSPRCTERSGYPNMQSLLACPRFNQRTSNYDRPSAPLSTLPSVMTTGWTFYILRCRILSCVLLTHRADIARWFPLTLTQCHPLAMAPGYTYVCPTPPTQLLGRGEEEDTVFWAPARTNIPTRPSESSIDPYVEHSFFFNCFSF